LLSTTAMRSLGFVGVLLLATTGFAATVPQLVLNNDKQDATRQHAIVGVNEATADVPPRQQTHGVIETNQTIYQYLSQELRYTKLVKLIDWDEEYVTVLNATTDSITFFAPDNKALTPHHKKKHHKSTLSLSTVYEEYERLQVNAKDDGDDDDEEKKKRFKKILHALLQYHTLPAAIGRPGLSSNFTYETALEAHDGSYGGQPRRIGVYTGLLGLSINFYVGIEWASVAAANGFLYGVNKPIIPPPSILDELFYADNFSILTSALQKVGLDDSLQWRFKKSSETEGDGPVVSFFAPSDWAFKRLPPRLRFFLFSPAGEKVLKKLLQFHIVPDYILHSDWVYDATSDDKSLYSRLDIDECDGEDWYADSTVGALPNRRYRKMSRKWGKFARKITSAIRLFSKDGAANEEAPKRCFKNRRIMAEDDTSNTWPHHGHHDNVKITVNITVPTLLEEHPVRFVVGKYIESNHSMTEDVSDGKVTRATTWPRFIRSYTFVDGTPVQIEGVARNGAIYGLNRLLNPCKSGHKKDDEEDKSWDDWEDYLPAWGEQ